jgi:hypothetical protein
MLEWTTPVQSYHETIPSCLEEASGAHIWLSAHLGIVSQPWDERSSSLRIRLYLELFLQLPREWGEMGTGARENISRAKNTSVGVRRII